MEADRNLGEPPADHRGDHAVTFSRGFDTRTLAGERLNNGLTFESSQLVADAEMRSSTEVQRRRPGSVDDKPIRFVEGRFVAVRRGDHASDPCADWKYHTGDLDVAGCVSGGHLNRRLPA